MPDSTDEWWIKNALAEGDAVVHAGVPDQSDDAHEVAVGASGAPGASSENPLPFGQFVNWMRRRKGLSTEALAREAEVDASELATIEQNGRYVPEPRTVYRLALFFGFQQSSLMELSGLSESRNSAQPDVVRFAASSNAAGALSPEELEALEALVSVLGRRHAPG